MSHPISRRARLSLTIGMGTFALIAIIVAVVLAFLAFRFVMGMAKFAVLGVILLALLFVAYQSGAF